MIRIFLMHETQLGKIDTTKAQHIHAHTHANMLYDDTTLQRHTTDDMHHLSWVT